MFKMFRKNYRRAVAYLLTVAMAFTNLNWNAGAVFAAGESEGALFLVDGQELKQAIDSTVMGGDVFDFSSLELVAEKKSIRNKYKAALGVGNVYELELGVDCQHAPEETSMRVFYSAATRKVIFLFLNESEQAVSFRVNIDGYETAEVEVKPNAERMMDESDRVFAENYESGDMIDDEAKKPSAEVVGSAEDTEAEGKEEEEKDPEAGENTDSETGASEEETSAAGSEADGENAGDKEEVPSGTEALESEGIAEESQEETTAEEKKEAEAEAMTETENEAEKEDRPFEDSDEAAGEEVASISRHEAVLVATANGLPEEGLTAPENMEDEGDKDSEIGDEDHGAEEAPEEDKSEAVDMPEAADPVETAAPTEEVESASGAGEAEGTAGAEETDRETDQAEESNPSEESSSEEESGSAEESNPEEATAPSEGETAAPAESDSQPGEETEAPAESTAENKEKEEGQVLEGEDLEHLGALEGRDLPTVTVLDHVNARAFQADVDDIFAIVANAEEDRFGEYDFVLPLSMPDPENEESEEFVPFAMPLGAEMLELKGVAPETEGAWSSSDPEILSIDETGFVETHTLGEVEVNFTYEAFAGEADSADAEGAEEDNGSEVTLTWKVLVYDEQYNMLADAIIMIGFPRYYEPDWGLRGNFGGTGGLTYRNGWTSTSAGTAYTTTHAIRQGSTTEVAYCIEPGVYIGPSEGLGNNLKENGENWWDDLDRYNGTGLTGRQIKILIGRIISAGYNGEVYSSWGKDRIDDAEKIIATQLLVWEVVVGERDIEFNHIDITNKEAANGLKPIKQYIGQDHLWQADIYKHYSTIESNVKQKCKVPKLKGNKTLTWNKENRRFETTLIDTENIINSYTFVQNNKVNVSKKGNTITIWTREALVGDVELKAKSEDISRKGLVVWSDDKRGGIQDIVTYSGETQDKNEISITVNTKGTAKIDLDVIKINGDTEEQLSGAEFSLAGPAKPGTYATDLNGKISFADLTPGEYTLTETKAPSGYKLPDNPEIKFTVSNGGVVSIKSGSATLSQDKKTMTISNRFEIEITVVKVDKESGKKRTDLAGATFELADATGRYSGDYRIGEDGTVKIPINRKGHYTLREKVAPKGYLKLDKTFGFEVKANGEVEWDNDVERGEFVHDLDPNAIDIPNTRTVDLKIKKEVDKKYPDKSEEFAPAIEYFIEIRLGNSDEEHQVVSSPIKYQGEGIYKWSLTDGSEVVITGIPTGTEYTIKEVLHDDQKATGHKLNVIVTDDPSDNNQFLDDILTDTVEAKDSVNDRNETVTIKNDYFNSKVRNLEVKKSWVDENGKELGKDLQPEKIVVELRYAQVQKDSSGNPIEGSYGEFYPYNLEYFDDITESIKKYDPVCELTAEKDWAATFKNLPLYDWDGNEYQYSVVEKEITPNEKWGELGWSVEGTPAPTQIEGSNIFRVYGADKVMKQNTETNEWEETGDYEVRGVFAAASDAVTLPATEEGENLEEPVQYPITNTWIPAEKLGTGFTIKKIDSETGEPLQNAVFAMKFYQEPESGEALSDIGDPEDREEENGETKEPETIFEVKTNEDGFATFPELPVGRYVLWEKTAPEGYLPIPEEMKLIVNIRKDLVEVFSEDEEQKVWKNRYQWSNEVVHAADVMKDLTNDLSDLDLGGILTIANDPIKGRISLSKHIRLNGSIEKWLNEFSFGIYDSEGKLVDTIVVKANDEVKTSRELRYGKYTVAEIVDGSIVGGYTWTGAEFELNDGDNKIGINLDSNRFQFDIKEDGEIVRVEATNDYVRQPGGGGGGGGGGGSRSGGGGGGTTMITDPAVPLANLPEELVTLPEEDVPLAGLLPQTGDARNIAMWLLLFGGAGIGMLLAAMGLKKKKEEE